MVDSRAGNSGPIVDTPATANIAAVVACAANTTTETSLTVAGLAVGDQVYVTPAAGVTVPAGLGIGFAVVSAANTLVLRFVNATAGSLNWPAGDLNLDVRKAA